VNGVAACAGRELVASLGLRAVEGLSLEWISKNLYFTDNSGFIGVIRLRSRHFQDVRRLITDLGSPRAIVMNPYVGCVAALSCSGGSRTFERRTGAATGRKTLYQTRRHLSQMHIIRVLCEKRRLAEKKLLWPIGRKDMAA